MKASEVRQKFIKFFVEKHEHKEIKGSSLIPENDPTVLFTTAGMHPLVPYLLGETHPEGRRLVDVQKCIRTGDVDEVGDDSHLTFFEMLGNWSLGDYFKKEAINFSYEFLTSELGIDPARILVTCFEGDENAPRDEEAAEIWRGLGMTVFFYEKKKNWWGPAGLTGPCGPDTEMFYDKCPELAAGEHKVGASEELIKKYPIASGECHPNCECGRYVEIWNDVFMQYNKNEDGTFTPLVQQNVDTGMGLERVAALLQEKKTPFETELFEPVMKRIRELAKDYNETSARVVADHLRAAVFILGDERSVSPSNNDQGYVLRKIIRRAIRHGRKMGISEGFTVQIARLFLGINGEYYKELIKYEKRILDELKKEEEQFQNALTAGEMEIEKDIEKVKESLEILSADNVVSQLEKALNGVSTIIASAGCLEVFNKTLRPLMGKLRAEFKGEAAGKKIDEEALGAVREKANYLKTEGWILRGDRAFLYYESFGFPLEMTVEMMKERGVEVDREGFDKAYELHQEKSRAGAEQKFAGGLADHSHESKKLHTATHLMLESLRRLFGNHIEQRGSNITQERLRFDFNFDRKLSAEELAKIEVFVNDAIKADYPVSFKEMTVEEAKKLNATGIFVDKYEGELGGKVKVYFMGDFSKEICGGPHVDHTGELGSFKITKEEASSSGVRRIKAVVGK